MATIKIPSYHGLRGKETPRVKVRAGGIVDANGVVTHRTRPPVVMRHRPGTMMTERRRKK